MSLAQPVSSISGATKPTRSRFSDWLRQPFARALLLIMVVGIVLRISAVWTIPAQPVSDFWAHYQRALNVYRYGHYEVFRGMPNASHPPAYPLLLALGFFLSGGVHTLAVAKLINCGLGGVTILMGALMARKLWGGYAGLFGALLSALYPRYILTVCVLASENLFAPLLLLFVFLSILAARSKFSPKGGMLGGAVLGLLALTRSIAYFMGFIWLLSALAGRKKVRPILLELVVLLTFQHAVMLPWAIRNKTAIGHFTFLATSGGIGLFIGNNSNATGGYYDWLTDLERVSPGIRKKSAAEIDDAARAAAFDWIKHYPMQAAKLYLEKLRLLAVQDTLIAEWAIFGQKVTPPIPEGDVLPWPHPLKNHPRAVNLVLRLAAGTASLLGILGFLILFVRAFRSRAREDWSVAVTFLAAAAFLTFFSALFAVNGRYRWPVEDLLIPVAASLLAWEPIAHMLARLRGRPVSGEFLETSVANSAANPRPRSR